MVIKYQPDNDPNSTICVIIWCVWYKQLPLIDEQSTKSGSHHHTAPPRHSHVWDKHSLTLVRENSVNMLTNPCKQTLTHWHTHTMWSCLNDEWLAGMGVFLWKLSVKEQEAYFSTSALEITRVYSTGSVLSSIQPFSRLPWREDWRLEDTSVLPLLCDAVV